MVFMYFNSFAMPLVVQIIVTFYLDWFLSPFFVTSKHACPEEVRETECANKRRLL